MEKDKKITRYALASMSALKNEYKTVMYYDETAFITAVQNLNQNVVTRYIGMKDTPAIRPTVEKLESIEKKEIVYRLHTIDAMARGGRAVDSLRLNPLTLRQMTGSSSGTAINVLIGINDIGVGSDGGGSVLAPAISVNLYSLMSPKFPIEKQMKKSTDQISFSPSAGLITRSLNILKEAAVDCLGEMKQTSVEKLYVVNEQPEVIEKLQHNYQQIENIEVNTTNSRESLIKWLTNNMEKVDVIISKEGPIDTEAYGDTLQGCFSVHDTEKQHKSNKGLLRVVNMSGLSAITVPAAQLATGYLIITASTIEGISKGFEIAEQLQQSFPSIIEEYFHCQ